MFSRLTLIIFLAIALGAFLVLRPYLFKKEEKPRIEDRLPDADFLGHARILNIAKEASSLLYNYKVPYREFLSEEFILAQAKNYGMQIQNPSFLFANKDGSWGGIAELTDSSKASAGIDKLKHLFPIIDTVIASKKVYHFEKTNGYLLYDNDYIFYYQGKFAKKYIERVVFAKANQISFNWRNFLNNKKYLSQNLSIYSNAPYFNDLSISEAFAYPIIDSTHITLFAQFKSKDTIPIQLKPAGVNFKNAKDTDKLINLHLDHSRLMKNTSHPFYAFLLKQGRKIGFPMDQFLQVWDGDLSFSQGGFVTSKEKYIESELDDDFNVTQVEKERDVKVPGFALMFTTNDSGLNFFKRLLLKGVLTEQEDGMHFLLSPALKVQKSRKNQLYFSSYTAPRMGVDSISQITWNQQGTIYQFTIDSIHTFDFYGKLNFPMGRILRSNNLVQ